MEQPSTSIADRRRKLRKAGHTLRKERHTTPGLTHSKPSIAPGEPGLPARVRRRLVIRKTFPTRALAVEWQEASKPKVPQGAMRARTVRVDSISDQRDTPYVTSPSYGGRLATVRTHAHSALSRQGGRSNVSER